MLTIVILAPIITAAISAIVGVIMLNNGILDISLWCINYAGMIGMVYIIGGLMYMLAKIVNTITQDKE